MSKSLAVAYAVRKHAGQSAVARPKTAAVIEAPELSFDSQEFDALEPEPKESQLEKVMQKYKYANMPRGSAKLQEDPNEN